MTIIIERLMNIHSESDLVIIDELDEVLLLLFIVNVHAGNNQQERSEANELDQCSPEVIESKVILGPSIGL